jgi:hypothetical protein
MHSIAKTWEHELEAPHHRLGELFRRPEPRQRSLAYLKGLLVLKSRSKASCILHRVILVRDRLSNDSASQWVLPCSSKCSV